MSVESILSIIEKNVIHDYYTAGIKTEVVIDTLITPVITELIKEMLESSGDKSIAGDLVYITKEFPMIKHKEDGSYDTQTLPSVFYERLIHNHGFRLLKGKDDFRSDVNVINVFPYCYFNSRDFVDIKQYTDSYCSHNFVGSWLKEGGIVKSWVKNIIPRSLLNRYDHFIYFILGIGEFHNIQLPYQRP